METTLIKPNTTLIIRVPEFFSGDSEPVKTAHSEEAAMVPSSLILPARRSSKSEVGSLSKGAHLECPLGRIERSSGRIDTFLAQYFTCYSRAFFQNLVEKNHIILNNKHVKKPSISVKTGDEITVHFPALPTLESKNISDKELGVKILFEHEHFLIISKPAGLVVHAPSTQSTEITLVDWLITNFKELKTVGSNDRPGIVHRLDKDTSGIMVIPRNNYALAQFGDMFKNRTIHKKYLALVAGHPEKAGSIDYRIDRHRTEPYKMTHLYGSGREALTHYKTVEYFKETALIEASPVTGRTHQIRVHCAAINHAVIGDQLYGKKSVLIDRQALHAAEISFNFENKNYIFTAELPTDMQKLIKYYQS